MTAPSGVYSPNPGESWTYAYDELDRLTTATNTSNAALNQRFTASIDGNILTATGIGNGLLGTLTNIMICNTQYK